MLIPRETTFALKHTELRGHMGGPTTLLAVGRSPEVDIPRLLVTISSHQNALRKIYLHIDSAQVVTTSKRILATFQFSTFKMQAPVVVMSNIPTLQPAWWEFTYSTNIHVQTPRRATDKWGEKHSYPISQQPRRKL